MQSNPFIYGNPVSVSQFIGRRKYLRRISGRVVSGQSTALIGDPHIGKTSLLNYLQSPEKCQDLYGKEALNWTFKLLDAHMLGSQCTPAQFWEQALAALPEEYRGQLGTDRPMLNFVLEPIFTRLHADGRRLVLLIDEFDALLHHPVLNSAEFFGGLRSLASRNQALTLIIASRQPIAQLNTGTQALNPSGSPFFNIFAETMLGPFESDDVSGLLALAGAHFTPPDYQFLAAVAGAHPFLLQAASSFLWEAYTEDADAFPEQIRRQIAGRLYREFDHFFSDTWQVWTPAMRKAFTAVAIAHQAALLPETKFRLSGLLKEFQCWNPECNDLVERGLISKDARTETGYRISSGILLTWLADELVTVIRSDQPFDAWLQQQQIEGAFLSEHEKKVFKEAVTGMAKALGQGATAIIEAFGKGVGASLAGKVI